MTDNILTSDNMDNEHIQLTEMEKKVILRLADLGSLSGYDFHLGGRRERGSRKAIMSSGKWNPLRKRLGPEGMNLIKLIKSSGRPKTGKGRRKDLYWLTIGGIKASLTEDASPKTLRKYVNSYYPQSDETEYVNCILELFQVAVMKKFLVSVLRREISEGDMMLERLSYLADFCLVKEFDADSKKRTVDILRKYPQVFQSFKNAVKEGKKKMDELDKELNP